VDRLQSLPFGSCQANLLSTLRILQYDGIVFGNSTMGVNPACGKFKCQTTMAAMVLSWYFISASDGIFGRKMSYALSSHSGNSCLSTVCQNKASCAPSFLSDILLVHI